MSPVDPDEVYRNLNPADIPWNFEFPPDELVELVETNKIKPCRALELGCGAGNNSIWLASKGFEVTGIDFSPTAIQLAKENAARKEVECTFQVADVTDNLKKLFNKNFDFAFDWEVLHQIYPEKRNQFVKNVASLLHPGAFYFSVCFSELDKAFGGSGKYRTTSLGSVLYFSSEKELHDLFTLYFDILELKTIGIRGKSLTHKVNYVFMKAKSGKLNS